MNTGENTVCIYHSADLDGICSGAIMRHFLPGATYLGYDYGKLFPWGLIAGKDVYMADVSLPVDDMFRLKRQAKRFVWIDHHKTAIEEAENAGFETPGALVIGKAACELTWEFLAGDRVPVPLAVTLLGRYDVWDHSDLRTLPFQYGMRMKVKEGVYDVLWSDLFSGIGDYLVRSVVQIGELILEYQAGEDAKYAKATAFEANFHGLKVVACNKGLSNSKLFDAVYDADRHDAVVLFYRQKRGTWKVSLYTSKAGVDVGAIAKSLGGGGHEKAAGYIAKSCPF